MVHDALLLMLIKRFCFLDPAYDEKYIQPMMRDRGRSNRPAERSGSSTTSASKPGGILPPVRPYLMDRHNRGR